MTSKERKGFEQWLELHSTNNQEADSLRKLWKATGFYNEQYQPDVEKGLNKFKARMKNDTPVGGKVVRLNPWANWLKIAAAAVVIFGMVHLFKVAFPGVVPTETVAAEAGNQKALMLGDGTSVTLNETSSLTFPEDFTKKERRVDLKGEAFFEVAKDASKPFVVETELAEVQVLGTSFNVRAYAGENLVEVYVKTGKVAVRLKNSKKQVELNPGEKMVFEKKLNKVVSAKDATGNSLAWKDGILIFKEKTFREIFSEIEHHFGFEIQVKDKQLLNCRYTVTVEKDQVLEDLNSIKISCPVNFKEVSPKNIIVSGNCCE